MCIRDRGGVLSFWAVFHWWTLIIILVPRYNSESFLECTNPRIQNPEYSFPGMSIRDSLEVHERNCIEFAYFWAGYHLRTLLLILVPGQNPESVFSNVQIPESKIPYNWVGANEKGLSAKTVFWDTSVWKLNLVSFLLVTSSVDRATPCYDLARRV